MKNFLMLIGAILFINCGNETKTKTNTYIVESTSQRTLEIAYEISKEKTIKDLKEIWNCDTVFISKSTITLNGKESQNISLMILGNISLDTEIKEKNMALTFDVVKHNISNYLKFSELRIGTGYVTVDGERRVYSKSIKTTDL